MKSQIETKRTFAEYMALLKSGVMLSGEDVTEFMRLQEAESKRRTEDNFDRTLKARKRKFLSYTEGKEAIRFSDSYNRLPMILNLRPEMQAKTWFKLLGEKWTQCDNISTYKDEILFEARHSSGGSITIAAMMDAKERRKLAAMPDVITIYRGCYKVNANGICWTTDKAVAEKFPSMNRYHREGDQALLLTATIRKQDVIAFKMDRKEFEIIVDPDSLLNVKRTKITHTSARMSMEAA